MELSLARGARPITLDRERWLFFGNEAVWLLYQEYGPLFATALYTAEKKDGKAELRLKSMEALVFFLWVGLQADAKLHEEELTIERVRELIVPFNFVRIFNSLVLALAVAISAPEPPGKAPAAGSPAAPAAPKAPGPTKVSTSLKRSASPTPSSAGRQKRSGKRR